MMVLVSCLQQRFTSLQPTQLSVSLQLSLQLSGGRVGEEELFTAALF